MPHRPPTPSHAPLDTSLQLRFIDYLIEGWCPGWRPDPMASPDPAHLNGGIKKNRTINPSPKKVIIDLVLVGSNGEEHVPIPATDEY